MKNKIILTLFLVLFLFSFSFAEIPIYCPHERVLLYYYQKEIIAGTSLRAEDFKPANDLIPQPQENTPMVCPFCNSPLNGYEWFIWEKEMAPIKLVYQAITLLTRDKEGNFKFVPYNFLPEDWEGKH